MELTTSHIKRALTVAGFTILLTGGLHAQAKLSLTKSASNTVSVNLENSVSVAALQFTVNGSSNLTLNSAGKAGRTQDASWQIHQHQVNDSTVNVVILNAGLVNIPTGEGAVAEFSFSDNGSAHVSYATLSRVVVANQFARKVSVEISNVTWTNSIAQVEEKEFTLEQNYPNPFNPSTTIRYKLEQPGQVTLNIYDITGREVKRVMDQYTFAGTHSVTWNGRDEAGSQVASGVYFARLNMNGKFATLKMNLTK
ncbi:MAG: T9SS type A sorting domain-containing protein [Ignavibacteriae bacterium]|nr:T9SS type A sorting domain-containing protein [Ignavibacteriota bacterium]